MAKTSATVGAAFLFISPLPPQKTPALIPYNQGGFRTQPKDVAALVAVGGVDRLQPGGDFVDAKYPQGIHRRQNIQKWHLRPVSVWGPPRNLPRLYHCCFPDPLRNPLAVNGSPAKSCARLPTSLRHLIHRYLQAGQHHSPVRLLLCCVHL